MANVKIRCPTCNQEGNIEIKQGTLDKITRGVIAINVAPSIVCEHSFIAYIDKNLAVRDYFTADFQIELPEMSSQAFTGDTTLPSKDVINLDLIKLNLHASLLTYVLRAIFMRKRVLILLEEPFLKTHIENFFLYITKGSFQTNIEILTKQEYKKNKKAYKDALILQETKIVKNPYKNLNLDKLKVEKQIINQFLSEIDLNLSYIHLKNEIYKAYKLANEIVDYINEKGGELKVQTEDKPGGSLLSNILDEILDKRKYLHKIFTKVLNKRFNIKIQSNYLDFLFEIVNQYFNIDLKKRVKA